MRKMTILRLLLFLTVPALFLFWHEKPKAILPKLVKVVSKKKKEASRPDTKGYQKMLRNVSASRDSMSSIIGSDATKKLAALQWTSFMTDSIFPYWYGTEWDFNGHTNEPNEGEIACGYFVSTTLKHSGIPLDRYKTAQKAASDIIDQLCERSSKKWFNSLGEMEDHLRGKPDGLFVLGLDYHVGFVLKEDDRHFFIHSDYFNGEVTKEALDRSSAAKSSDRFYLGSLSQNERLIEKWLKVR